MKIIHIINSLKKGGAEGNLYRLCKFHKKKYNNKIDILIITLIDDGFYEADLKRKGIKIISLDINKINIANLVRKIITLRRLIQNQKPDVIQSWMYHSNFMTIFLPVMFHNKLFWNIRHSELNFKISKKLTICISIICGFFSRIIPRKIIYNSEKSILFHQKYHLYSKSKTLLIYNGYSDKTYYPSKNLRSKFRKNNKISKADIIVGFAGRYARQKNIYTLIFAFSKIIKKHDNVYLYMAGRDMKTDNNNLSTYVNKLKINNKIIFLGEQKNLIEFYNGIDFLILPSHSESFPNVIAESMLCCTPVLSSNAGCSKKIINNCGFTFVKTDNESIFKNLQKIINFFIKNKTEWKTLQQRSRNQIINNFSITNMAETYLKKWTL